MENKIFGITFKHEPINVNEKFEERFFDDDNAFFNSKEIFTHDEDDYKFNYQYAITADVCEGNVFYALYLVPCADSLNKEKLQSVASSCGVEVDEVEIYDISSYGCQVLIGSECIKGEEIDETILNNIASVFESINSLRGFYLDKYVNRIGTTGWDLLDDFVNGNDFVKKALG